MEFRIADTFTDSLTRLTGEEQKAVKTTAFDLQMDPTNPGMSFHKLEKARDRNFWSVRVNTDIRLIVHRTPNSLLLCYVDHHDRAYHWAERRKLETHPRTGAAQLVELRETVQEVVIQTYVAAPQTPSVLFARLSDEDLMSYGVPMEWLNEVRLATEDTLLTLATHLPGEAAEALLDLATGGVPRIPQPAFQTAAPFQHPDAQRRFRLVSTGQELERALDFPWDRWTIFLHPEQRQWVERDYNGPARISGSAGTGKTIVALHRAVFLARQHPDARVLVTTFSRILAHDLDGRLKRLVSNEPRLAERLDVYSIDDIGARLYRSHFEPPNPASAGVIRELITQASEEVGGHRFSLHFLLSEWDQVVDAWQLANWEEYRDVARLGRKTRLPEAQRAILWSLFERVQSELAARSMITPAGMFSRLATHMAALKHPPFDFVVVDEAQDLGIAQLRFFAALGRSRPDALFFAGDQGQRIFQQPFSWKSLGVDVRGRCRTLRVNYRTSHQIRKQADRLLGTEVADADGNTEERSGTVSVFNGPVPTIRVFDTEAQERADVAAWLSERLAAGLARHEFGLFVRSTAQLDRARAVLETAGIPYKVLDEATNTTAGHAVISTMHLAKGLEFRAVAVMACDDEVVPLQERIETIGDESDLHEVYATERHLLYVACTRARDHLLVTAVQPASEFLDDLRV
jgi:superfamily I DNA/RNA helicase/mRNA-degrading endonuclease RelE of RelBE toxin-antitoxin system